MRSKRRVNSGYPFHDYDDDSWHDLVFAASMNRIEITVAPFGHPALF